MVAIVQKSSGGRTIARGQRYLVCVVLGVFCLLLVQFWACEQRWNSQHSSTGGSRALKAMLKKYWFLEDRDNGIGKIRDSLLPMEMMQAVNLCEPNSGTVGSENDEGGKLASEQCLMKLLARHSPFKKSSLPARAALPHEPREIEADKRRKEVWENETKTLSDRLKKSTVFLELKDNRESGLSDSDGHWFMSSLRRPKKDGLPEEFDFPSESSHGRILCVMGNNRRDGTQNKYGFAWKDHLPPNATLLPGITLVADNYWDYTNIWHGMSSLVSFVSWRARNACVTPQRVVLYHWGELMPTMGSWITNVLHASFGRKLEVETLENSGSQGPAVCFERAVVHRRGVGSMSKDNMNSLFENIRCRARKFCGVIVPEPVVSGAANVTLLVRTGARSFKNTTAVSGVIGDVCAELGSCHLEIAYISNLTFCEQVALMSRTDVLVTAHGAQLTNSMFMSKGSSVMELIPKGWKEFGGVGQYIYAWLADWSNLEHEGVWRDPEGPDCPYPTEETLRCFLFHKDALVGLNATYLADWTKKVVTDFKSRSRQMAIDRGTSLGNNCTCDSVDHDIQKW